MVGNQLMASANIDEGVLFSQLALNQGTTSKTHLHQVWTHTPYEVYIDEVWLREERPQARCLEFLPPLEELGEVLPSSAAEYMHFELKLAKRQRFSAETVNENLKRVELVTLDVDLEHVDEVMTIPLHQGTQSKHLGIVCQTEGIFSTKSIGEEVRTALQVRLEFNLWSKLTEVND